MTPQSSRHMPAEMHVEGVLAPDIRDCVAACLDCYQTCLTTAMHHCLEAGGEHTEPTHFRLMMACAEICRSAAHFMLLGSDDHARLCAECARICTACADDCERLGGMTACVDACRRCAEHCRTMAQ
ncbi:four-helix bundle copper-binding protein [Halodurantibacterium flavum]|uniref:Four-helix bundle copper-binding protein n=1 Tax=Halodurantibacterium flavum TaxID=1382802 RepID=A0ABW4RZR6_9RHOB